MILWKNTANPVEEYSKIQTSKYALTVEINYLLEQAGNQFQENSATKYSKEMDIDAESAALPTKKHDCMWTISNQWQKAELMT